MPVARVATTRPNAHMQPCATTKEANEVAVVVVALDRLFACKLESIFGTAVISSTTPALAGKKYKSE